MRSVPVRMQRSTGPVGGLHKVRLPLLLLFALACGGEAPAGPVGEPPRITVIGVTDGESREGPVTITITIDRGAYVAELNGDTFISGRTVSAPGDYLLRVTARDGEAVASLELRFRILLSGETRLIVRVFDLGANESGGGGDAILLTDSSGAGSRHVLIDAGPAGTAGSDPDFVSRRLTALGVDTIAALILTHAHSDHFDGISAILQRFVVLRFFYNGQVRNFSRYTATITEAELRAGDVTVPSAVIALDQGLGTMPTRVAILPPLTTFLAKADADGEEINEGSLGAAVEKGDVRLFFTGDGEVRANQRWRTQFAGRTGSVTVLKVGHHGANDAMFDNGFNGTSSWLTHAAPEVAVISANGVTHPRVNAIDRLLGLPQTRTYCTNVHGDIEIRIGERGGLLVTVERNASSDCVPGSDATS